MSEHKDVQEYMKELIASSQYFWQDVGRFIKGKNADYNPKYYFEYAGGIYVKLKFEDAYKLDFNYPRVDSIRQCSGLRI